MNSKERTVAYDGGQLFRVEHQVIPGRGLPYEFVRRVGATTVLPVTDIEGKPHVIGIRNTRTYYGTSLGLPGGNADGGFEKPEHPTITGLRELREETGYGYPAGVAARIDTFQLRPVSSTILYDRSFAVARDVTYVGGEMKNEREVVEVMMAPLHAYMDSVFDTQQANLYPEVKLAFAKAGREVGHDAVLDWMVHGDLSYQAKAVSQSFAPWMTPVHSPSV